MWSYFIIWGKTQWGKPKKKTNTNKSKSFTKSDYTMMQFTNDDHDDVDDDCLIQLTYLLFKN